MGRYVNPGNDGFARILRREYVDKTGLVSLFDSTLGTPRSLVMVSRPRRFGKSFAAQSLVAFYSVGTDSRVLFEGLEVSRREGWDEHLNKYNVLRLDMAEVMQSAEGADAVAAVTEAVLPELRELASGAGSDATSTKSAVASALWDAVQATGRKFVFVIDEWDAPYRLAQGERAAQDAYADVAYLPRAGSGVPALLVELKWDQPVRAAVDQILERDYPQVLRGLGVPVLLVAVTYDAKTKEHSCRIEQVER